MFDMYVRMNLQAVSELVFRHLQSEVDTRGPEGGALRGYTEWIADHEPAVSLGWDWTADYGMMEVRPVELSLRTNLMLTLDDGVDAGLGQTFVALRAHIGGLAWADAVRCAVLRSS